MKIVVSMLVMACLSGCASFSTRQTDVSDVNEFGQPRRTITTTAKATTFYDSSSALAKFKAIQNDKSQSASVGALEQSATSTNINALIQQIAAGVAEGMMKGMKP